LGKTLLEEGKFGEAEPLLLSAFEGMERQQGKMPSTIRPQMTDTIETLSKLYDATGKPEEAAKWRGDLEKQKREVQPGPGTSGQQ
jgi:hypothetical protein